MATIPTSVNEMQERNRAGGGHWFDPDSMRFFGSRILPEIYSGPGGVYFVSSEQPPHGPSVYKVRSFNCATGGVDSVGGHDVESWLPSSAAARRLARRMAAGEGASCASCRGSRCRPIRANGAVTPRATCRT